MKNIGDLALHSLSYVAHKEDIDSTLSKIRSLIKELVYLAKLKNFLLNSKLTTPLSTLKRLIYPERRDVV